MEVSAAVPFELPFEVPVRVYPGGVMPSRAHESDAGLDLRAAFDNPQGMVLRPGQVASVATEVAVAIPEGLVGLVAPRSGLAFQHGVSLLNSPGVIDAGYRGKVHVLLINHGTQPYHVRPGDRIAQLVLVRLAPVVLVQVEALPLDTERGQFGFGSTGR